jgi:AcrR family transcriptional regulator
MKREAGKPMAAAPTKQRQRLAPSDRRQQIVSAAIAYFAEVGFDGGTRALAKRLGVTQPLIYRYFPSKDDLIRTVYEEVYLNRWQSEWEALLRDRTLPLRERLVAFYERYTAVIFAPEWIRIYLFSGLRGLEINHWWTRFVEEHVLRTICEAVRDAHGLPDSSAHPIQPEELDLAWMFHGGIFYYGLRREVYGAAPKLALRRFIACSIDSLLDGFPATAARLLHAPQPADA